MEPVKDLRGTRWTDSEDRAVSDAYQTTMTVQEFLDKVRYNMWGAAGAGIQLRTMKAYQSRLWHLKLGVGRAVGNPTLHIAMLAVCLTEENEEKSAKAAKKAALTAVAVTDVPMEVLDVLMAVTVPSPVTDIPTPTDLGVGIEDDIPTPNQCQTSLARETNALQAVIVQRLKADFVGRELTIEVAQEVREAVRQELHRRMLAREWQVSFEGQKVRMKALT